MTWQETNVQNERLRFVHQYESGGFTMSELCERFGISRPTGYACWQRYLRDGRAGLMDRSRRPHTCPHQTAPELESRIVRVREAHQYWGPVTIVAYLRRQDPHLPWPAPSTAGQILQRHGLVKPRRKRRRVRHPGRPYLPMEAPNDVWPADFKGEFRTKDGRYCYPLTITDGRCRFLLACRARRNTSYELARPVFEETFLTYGLPYQILTDNGPPFGSTALAGLSRLSVWFIKLGIHPVRIEPGCPYQNGRHERMHGTLAAAVTRPPAGNLPAQQRRFNKFRTEYNEMRPHQALELQTPAELYLPSTRPYPSREPEVEYEGHFEVRKVDAAGRISWHDTPLRISKVLRGEYVGLEPIEEDMYRLYFGPVLLGVFDAKSWNIHG